MFGVCCPKLPYQNMSKKTYPSVRHHFIKTSRAAVSSEQTRLASPRPSDHVSKIRMTLVWRLRGAEMLEVAPPYPFNYTCLEMTIQRLPFLRYWELLLFQIAQVRGKVHEGGQTNVAHCGPLYLTLHDIWFDYAANNCQHKIYKIIYHSICRHVLNTRMAA